MLGAYFTIGALGGFAGPLIYVAIQEVTDGWRAYWVVFVLAAAVLGAFAIFSTPGRLDEEPPHAPSRPSRSARWRCSSG